MSTAMAIAIAVLSSCASRPNGVLFFRDGTHADCPGGIEFGKRTVCHTARGTLTVPANEIARYELR
jgi:hypothetical protein